MNLWWFNRRSAPWRDYKGMLRLLPGCPAKGANHGESDMVCREGL